MRDFDRALDASGKADAEKIGVVMHARDHVPDLTLCSTAVRARQTLEGIAGHADTGRVIFLDTLYSDDATGYLKSIRECGASQSVLVIGHNPMMEDLAVAVSGNGDPQALSTLAAGFPTSGLAVIDFDGGLGKAEPGTGHLRAFLTPSAS